MAGIDFTIDAPNEASLKVRFDKFNNDLRKALTGPINKATAQLYANVQANTPVDTGSLRGAEHSYVAQGDDWMRGYVTVGPERGEAFNVKAAALEYGSHKRISVGQYSTSRSVFWGLFSGPRQELIGQYFRRTNIDADRYLRDAFTPGLQESFKADIEAAIGEAAGVFNE
jgi:hypothetical protein